MLIYVVHSCLGGSGVAVGCWTCDQQVASSNPSRPAVGNLGQVFNTHVPLSPSSIIWFGVALATRHRHSWFSTHGLKAWRRQMSTRGVRVYLYPQIYPTWPVPKGMGTTSTGTGIPSFTCKEHDFSLFWSENLFISARFLNYLWWSNCSMARENSILLGAYNRLLTFLVF